MVAIPIGYDQPGVAARIAHHGVGEFVDVEELSPEGLRGLVQKVMESPSYGEKARFFKEVIARTRGLDVAADVIERPLVAERRARPLREAGLRAHAPTIVGTNSTGTPDRVSMPDGGRTSTRSSCSSSPRTAITRRRPGANRASGSAGTSRSAALTSRASKSAASGQPRRP